VLTGELRHHRLVDEVSGGKGVGQEMGAEGVGGTRLVGHRVVVERPSNQAWNSACRCSSYQRALWFSPMRPGVPGGGANVPCSVRPAADSGRWSPSPTPRSTPSTCPGRRSGRRGRAGPGRAAPAARLPGGGHFVDRAEEVAHCVTSPWVISTPLTITLSARRPGRVRPLRTLDIFLHERTDGAVAADRCRRTTPAAVSHFGARCTSLGRLGCCAGFRSPAEEIRFGRTAWHSDPWWAAPSYHPTAHQIGCAYPAGWTAGGGNPDNGGLPVPDGAARIAPGATRSARRRSVFRLSSAGLLVDVQPVALAEAHHHDNDLFECSDQGASTLGRAAICLLRVDRGMPALSGTENHLVVRRPCRQSLDATSVLLDARHAAGNIVTAGLEVVAIVIALAFTYRWAGGSAPVSFSFPSGWDRAAHANRARRSARHGGAVFRRRIACSGGQRTGQLGVHARLRRFILQAFLLLAAFVMYARVRWAPLFTMRTDAGPAGTTGPIQAALVNGAAIPAAGYALTYFIWAVGGRRWAPRRTSRLSRKEFSSP